MENGEKLIALENLIYQDAYNRFLFNGVSPTEAMIVMKNVYGTFQETCLNTMLMNRVTVNEGVETHDSEKTTIEDEENDSKDM